MVLASAIELFSRQARIKVILLNERTDGRFTDEPKHRFIALTLSVEDGQEARIFLKKILFLGATKTKTQPSRKSMQAVVVSKVLTSRK